MTQIVSYFVLPFVRVSEGGFLPRDVEAAPEEAKAKYRAFNLVHTMRGTDMIVGAVAFSRAGHEATGQFEVTVIIDRYGETTEIIEGLE
jgi:hypothetical protein